MCVSPTDQPAARIAIQEEEKAARAAQRDAAEAARRQRAERFGTQTSTPAAPLDPVEEEKKRKRMERFGLVPDTKEVSVLRSCPFGPAAC